MPAKKDKCPSCSKEKDVRAKLCRPCRNNDILNLEVLSKKEHHRLHIEPIKYEMSRKGHEARWGYKYATNIRPKM